MATRVVSSPTCEPSEALAELKSRRSILRSLMIGSLAAVWTSLVYPLVRYLIPPAEATTATNEALAAAVGELKPNSAKTFRFGSHPALLVRLGNGEYRSMSAVCTHLGCTVQYQPDTQQVWCPCHNGRYDLTGKNIQGPPPRPLVAFDVKVHGEEIHVSRRQDA
jgi:cytochrome b6-f complex iron-sulfur subunit